MSSPIALQPRDLSLLQGLFESRVMTLAHITALYFEGRDEAAKKRVQKLKAAEFIAERPRRANDPAIHFLTKRGYATLQAEGLLSKYPKCSADAFEMRAQVSALTLRHELQVLDVKAAFVSAVTKTQHFSVVEFSTWPTMHSFDSTHPKSGERITVKPDGFIRIHEQEADGGLSEHTFFLELDRSTESQEVLAAKAHCYAEFYRSGRFAEKNGARREEYKAWPFRVLVVCKSVERRNNAAKRLLENTPPILTQARLATVEEVTTDCLGNIWLVPKTLRDTESVSPGRGLLSFPTCALFAN